MALPPILPQKKKELIVAYELHGSAGAACAACGLNMGRWTWLMQADQKFRDKIDEIRARKIGEARNILWELVQKKHPTSVYYYLNRYDFEARNESRQTTADGAGLIPLGEINKEQLKEFIQKSKNEERKQSK